MLHLFNIEINHWLEISTYHKGIGPRWRIWTFPRLLCFSHWSRGRLKQSREFELMVVYVICASIICLISLWYPPTRQPITWLTIPFELCTLFLNFHPTDRLHCTVAEHQLYNPAATRTSWFLISFRTDLWGGMFALAVQWTCLRKVQRGIPCQMPQRTWNDHPPRQQLSQSVEQNGECDLTSTGKDSNLVGFRFVRHISRPTPRANQVLQLSVRILSVQFI